MYEGEWGWAERECVKGGWRKGCMGIKNVLQTPHPPQKHTRFPLFFAPIPPWLNLHRNGEEEEDLYAGKAERRADGCGEYHTAQNHALGEGVGEERGEGGGVGVRV